MPIPKTIEQEVRLGLKELGLLGLVDKRVAATAKLAQPCPPYEQRPDRSTMELPGSLSALEEDYQANDPLFGDKAAKTIRKTETARDRLIVMMKAQGMSDRAIAEQLNMNHSVVSNICRQPFARRLIIKTIEEEGRDKISTIVNGALEDSFATVIDIMSDEKSGPRARLSAAQIIQDRVMGKPKQYIEQRSGRLEASPENIDAKIAEQEARIAHLQGSAVKN